MGSHDPFGHLKHKLWTKERPRVKLVVWLPTIKNWQSPRFPWVQVACNTSLESSWWGLHLWFRPHFNWRSTHKVMGPQNHRSLNFRNFEIPIWESWDKMPFGCGFVEGHKVYYKGEGVGFPPVRAVMSYVSPSLPMVRPNTKSFSTMH
jgi:hypothetical protein